MKQLTCEMCGSTDLIKQDGVFVCETCGTKYSVEEAKKMMVEGTVEVAGTIKIDDSAKIANYYTIAESACDAGNQKEAENYCNKVIEIEPNNYKAWLLKGRAAGLQSTLDNIRLEESISYFCKAVDNAPEDQVKEVRKLARNEFSRVAFALIELCCDAYSENGSSDIEDKILDIVRPFVEYSKPDLYTGCSYLECDLPFMELGEDEERDIEIGDIMSDMASEIFSATRCARWRTDSFSTGGVSLLRRAIDIGLDKKDGYREIISLLRKDKLRLRDIHSSQSYAYVIKDIVEYQKKLREIDPSYTEDFEDSQQTSNQQTGNQQTNSGCYVATAVYGSYDCPQVWTLRRFRDYTLAKTWYGRLFIKTYYAISPTFVKWFGHTEWFKIMWKDKLDCMVANLNSVGVENTPYEDKEW